MGRLHKRAGDEFDSRSGHIFREQLRDRPPGWPS
jgi:hypothetical protein